MIMPYTLAHTLIDSNVVKNQLLRNLYHSISHLTKEVHLVTKPQEKDFQQI
jgi:hypothetical protein